MPKPANPQSRARHPERSEGAPSFPRLLRKGWALTIEQRNSSSLLGFLFSETVNCKLSTVDSSSRVPRRTTFRQPVSAALILSRHRPGSPSGSAIRQRTQHRPENRLPVLPAESRPLLRLPRTRDPCRSRSRDRIKCSAPLHCGPWPEVLSLLPSHITYL